MARPKAADYWQEEDSRVPQDFDPEDQQPEFEESEASSEDEGKENNIRDHYEKVGKSKLRKQSLPILGPRYSGARVSRKAAADEEDAEHDPFSDSDEAEDDSDSGIPLNIDEENEDASEEEADELKLADADELDSLEDGEASMTDDDEDGDEEDDTDDTSASEHANQTEESRAQLASLLNNTSKSIAATIAAANAADATKGQAVKQQRKTFDGLLNMRIRLQHGLIATNSLLAQPNEDGIPDNKAYEAAESAALNLFNSLSALRDTLPGQQRGSKRKRASFDSSSRSSELWSHLKAQDEDSAPHQRATLLKWSKKTQNSTAETATTANRLNPLAQTTLLDVLDSHTSSTNIPRLVAKTRLARSCAPVQQARPRKRKEQQKSDAHEAQVEEEGDEDDEDDDEDRIYDDADFYGILLKELLEARNANAAVDYSIAASNAAAESEYQATRKAKTHSRPDVDRKASKGRKMKYTVHEKLQNFMAPEDRGQWEARQRDELFGSLFGRRSALKEDMDVDEHDDLGEEEALMLFRN